MYSSRTSSTMSFTYPAPGAYRALPRNTEPEVFTFDRLPDPQLSAPRQQQQRRRVARVLYPAKVRKYLPPAEKSPAKRWLLALCLVLLAQIYTERDDELADMAEAAARSDARSAELQGDAAASSPLLLHFRSAEETARRLTSCSKAPAPWMNMSCSVEDEEAEEEAHEQHHPRTQQRNNPYVVALLYPAVIHTLGSEQ